MKRAVILGLAVLAFVAAGSPPHAPPAAHAAPARSAPALRVAPHQGYVPYHRDDRGGWYRGGFFFSPGFYYPYPYAYIYPGYVAPYAPYASYPSYAPPSIGAEVLQNYQLRQTPCGAPNVVTIWMPSGGQICAEPNDFLGPGSYTLDPSTLTIYSR